MAADLQDLAAAQGSAKGKLTVEIDFKVENGMFIIAAKHKVKLPDPNRAKSVAWTTDDNRFTPHKPNQGQLFGVRDVMKPANSDEHDLSGECLPSVPAMKAIYPEARNCNHSTDAA